MSKKNWLVAFALCDLSLLNAYAVYQYGYAGFVDAILANAATVSVLVDLTIALSLVLVWMRNDAKARGTSFLPYLPVTLLLGSIGPLLYLLRTGDRRAESPSPARFATGSVPLK